MNEYNKEVFTYDYSSKEQKEIRDIRNKYLGHKEKTTAEKIKELDAKTTIKAKIYSISTGIISSLIFGIGMCCIMVWTSLFIIEIIIGMIGMIGIALCYPIYNYFVKLERNKIKDEIIELCIELLPLINLSVVRRGRF